MASIGLVCLLREQAKQLEQERDSLKEALTIEKANSKHWEEVYTKWAETDLAATRLQELERERDEAVSAVQRLTAGESFDATVIADTVKRRTALIEQERDELNEKVTRLSALLEAEPFRNERIEQLEQERDTLILAVADHVTARSDQAAALKLSREALSGWIGSPNTEQYAALAAIDALKI